MSVLLDPTKDFNRFVELKPEDSYPKSVLKEIKLLTAYPNGTAIPFGSIIYRIQAYPGDVDLLEIYKQNGSPQTVANKFAKSLQDIVRRIKSDRLHYYSEIKCGVDKRYDINIGKMEKGFYTTNPNLRKKIIGLSNEGLITGEDEKLLLKNIKEVNNSKIQANQYDIITKILREYYILRWSEKEVLDGEKQLIGKNIKLNEALNMNTIIKIDEITDINNRFIEITNIFFLQSNYGGKTKDLNKENGPYIELPIEIEKLYYSNLYYNPFKCLKRIFAYSRASKNVDKPEFKDILEKIFPFISSSTSAMYQIKSELESISLIMERSKSIPIAKINNQIDYMKLRLASIIEIDKNDLNKILKLINLIVDSSKIGDKLILIDDLVKYLKKLINYNTITYLNKVSLNPLPKILLPPIATYNWYEIRSPTFESKLKY